MTVRRPSLTALARECDYFLQNWDKQRVLVGVDRDQLRILLARLRERIEPRTDVPYTPLFKVSPGTNSAASYAAFYQQEAKNLRWLVLQVAAEKMLGERAEAWMKGEPGGPAWSSLVQESEQGLATALEELGRLAAEKPPA